MLGNLYGSSRFILVGLATLTGSSRLILDGLGNQKKLAPPGKSRGLPLRQFFLGGGKGAFWRKKGRNAPWATDFREKRNPSQADSIVKYCQ